MGHQTIGRVEGDSYCLTVVFEVGQESDGKELAVLTLNQLCVGHATSDGQSVELSIGFVVVAHEFE